MNFLQAPLQRQYHVSLGFGCSKNCSYCNTIGNFDQPRKKWDIQRSIEKITSGNYTQARLSCGFLEHKNKNEIIETFRNQFKTRLQIHCQDLPLFLSEKTNYHDLEIEVVASTQDHLPRALLEELKEKNVSFNVLLIMLGSFKSCKKYLSYFPKNYRNNVSLFFPHKTSFFQKHLRPKQIFKLQELINDYKVAKNTDIFDPRISTDLNLEPTYSPLIENSQPNKNIIFSIVIPSYNNNFELLETLLSLAHQDYDKTNFEIIVVDDGSNDSTKMSVKNFATDHLSDLNFKYIFFPRNRKRIMGDARFRAGIARNLGVKQAQGRYLAFLDADMITPPDYLSTLFKEHQKYDVVQLQRLHLKANFQAKDIQFKNEECMKSHIEYPDGDYWKKFYLKAGSWNAWSHRWKYICTYGLSMKAEDFKAAGWFKKVFLYYGFEDTDLGYRLHKSNKSFLLSSIKAYHLFGAPKRNEYSHSVWARHKLLSKTAKIFYQNHIHTEIYKTLKVYMKY